MSYGLSVSLRSQQGLSLLNVMIGLVVSAASSLASISLYTNHQSATNGVKEDATLNRRVATSMVVLQNEITAAGFGIDDADEDDIVVLKSAASATSPAELSLFWRYRDLDTGDVICRGVHEFGSTVNGTDYRVLRIVEPLSACDTTSVLVDLTWHKQVGILSQWEINKGLEKYISDKGTLFDFEVAVGNCAPYGMTARRGNRLQATISSPNLAQLNEVAVAGNESKICLINTTTNTI